MTDWCLVETAQEVMYGSTDNVVNWYNVPLLVIVNVPDEIDLAEKELLQFLARDDILGPGHFLYRSIAGEGLSGSQPKYALIRLGGEMPDREMKNHITEDHASELQVYDWLIDNRLQENGPFFPDWYDPRVKNVFDFYKRYDILPHDGWKFWEYRLTTEEAKKK